MPRTRPTVRHGKNAGILYILFYNLPILVRDILFLADLMCLKVEMLGRWLAKEKLTRVYSSDYPRALDTALAILNQSSVNTKLEIIQDTRLRERVKKQETLQLSVFLYGKRKAEINMVNLFNSFFVLFFSQRMGVFEGKSYGEALAALVASGKKLMEFEIPEGESLEELTGRVGDFFRVSHYSLPTVNNSFYVNKNSQ